MMPRARRRRTIPGFAASQAKWLAALLLLGGSGAQAAVTVNKTFSPSSMTVNGTSTVTITLGNTGTTAATGAAFTDSLPSGLVVASPSSIVTTCGGTATANSGGSTIALSGGTVSPSGGSCTVTAAVTSSSLGSYTNTIPAGGVTSSQGSNGSAASATLAVIATQPVTGTYAITWPSGFGGRLKGNGPPATIAITLSNPNTLALTNTGLTFSIAQPVLAFASPSNESTTCGSGAVALNAGAGTGTLSAGSIPASGSCTIKFDIVAAQPNTYFYANAGIGIPASTITNDQGITNTVAINGAIAVQTGSRVDKSFSPASIVSGGTSTLTLTIHNLNYSGLSPINLTDTLPSAANGAMKVAPTPNASTTCGGSLTANAGAGSVQLSGASLPSVAANASGSVTCTVTLDVVGTNNVTSAINLTNSIPAGNFGGVNYPAVATNLTVTPSEPLFGSSKFVANEYYAGTLIGTPGSIHTVTVTLSNPTTSPVTVTSLTDDLTTMGSGFTAAASPAPSTTCAGGTVSAPVGGTLITMTGGTVPAGDGSTAGTCTLTAGVYVPMIPSALGVHTNRIPAGNIVTNAGSNATAISHGVNFVTPLAIAKSFVPAAVNPGGMSTLTISLSRMRRSNETGVDPLTNISATDALPAGLVIDTPSGLTHTCAGATVTAPDGGSTISFSGADLDPGAGCSIKVNVRVPPGTQAGVLQNLIPANSVTTDEGFTNGTRPTSSGAWGNGSAAANLTVGNANVTINKTFTPATVAVGTVSQLAINFVNTNPGNIQLTQAALSDALPAGMTVASPAGASFTGAGCAGTVSAAVGAASVGVSNATINAGATCTLKVNVVGTAAGNLINTIPAGALTSIQTVTNTAPASATLQATGTADLSITKTDNVAQVATGTTTTYTIVVGNAGPNNVIGATVTDTPPAGLTFTSWTCAASSGARCGAASGSGPINDTIDIDKGSTVTYTVIAQIAANFGGPSITNTATVTPPGIVADPVPDNNTASDTDTVVPGVVLALTKDDGSPTYTPGGTATYTVTVRNTGPANATQINVTDTLPSGVTLGGAVACTPAGTATCGTVAGGAGQTSFSATAATLPAGAGNTLTFTLPVRFAASLTTNPLINTVTATDVPTGATGSASDSDARSASADVSIVKAGPASAIPGGPVHYTLTIANAGPSPADGATFSDALPASISGATASCGGATGGAVCPGTVGVAGNTVSGTVPTLPPGGSVVVTIDGTISASTSAPITNTATVAPPAGTVDPASGNNTGTATTAIRPMVRIDKTVDASSVIPGDTVTYTVTVTNTGAVAADGTLVTDPMPNGITAQSWTCAASGGALCPNASGSGDINETIAMLPAGAAVVYTVTATVSNTPPANVNNTATATPPNGACAPTNTPAPCTATASLPPVPQVGVSKTADTTTVTPGGTIHYTIVVSNTGVVAADGTPVSDPLPTGIASQSWTCAASGGASCTASGSGAISDTIATFPAGSFVTYAVTATVDVNPPAIVSNTVTAAPSDPSAVCTPGNTPGPCMATANVTSNPQISLTKTADTTTLVPGGTVIYTVIVTNSGPVAADGTTVEDPLPAGIASQTWTCAANAGAVCTGSGSGAIGDTLTAFPPGSFVTYTVTATIAANPPATVTNIATANPPPGGICTPGNTPAPCEAQVSGGAVPQISVTKTADTNGALTPGGTVTYTVTVTNVGSADAAGTQVVDPLPAGLDAATWTCAASGAATCPNASGSGALDETIATLPPGGRVVYTITATVSATPPASIVNAASATPVDGVCLPGNTAPPCTATASNASAPRIAITKTADAPTYTAGSTLSWTVTVTNAGSAAADGTTVSDPLPAGIVSTAWSCLPGGGAVCANANGDGAIAESIPTFPAGATVTYLITGTVATPAPTSIANTASATPPAGGLCVTGAPPCTSTATTHSAPNVAIAKSVADANGNGVAEPGETLTYTIVLTNSGGTDAAAFGVTDPLDANTTFVSADHGGAFAGGVATWSGLTVPAGGSVTLQLVAKVASPLPAGVMQIANVAYRTGATAPSCPPVGAACVVLPTPGAVTIAKSVVDASGDGIASPGEALTYTILLTNTGGSDVVGYGVTDALDPNVVFGSADNDGTEAGNAVTWTDLTVPAGGSLALTVTVTVADPLPAGVARIVNVAYPTGTPAPACPPAGPQCVVLPTPGTVAIAKTVADASGNGIAEPGESLSYTIVLTNAGGSDVAGFDLTDPLDANLAFVSASHGGAFAGGRVNWTGLAVPAGGSLTLTVVATVANPLPSGVTAIGNVAYATGGTPPDCAATPRPASCASIPTAAQIKVAKSAEAPQPTGTPNEYALTYTVTVSNSGGSAGRYDLSDTLAFNGATVTAVGTPAYASSTGDTQTGMPGVFAAPAGGTIVTGEDLGAGGQETWTYTVTYAVTDPAVASDCTSALGGLRNHAALGGAAAGAAPADTCTGAAGVAVHKSAAAPVPTGQPSEYTLTYTVDVSNTGTLAGVYDLSDVLTFNGATVSAVTPPTYSSSTGDTQNGTLGGFAAPDGGYIVTGESIAAGGRETWTYAVTYTITDGAVAEDCAAPDTGLRNAAALGGSFSGQSATCTGAPAVVVGKSASGPVPTGQPNEYAVTYVVSVQNNGSLSGTYDLDDTLTFPGVGNVTVGAVTHGGPDPLGSTLGTLAADGGNIVLGETIAAGASESYTYTVTFTVDSAAAVGACAAGGGLANEARLGGSSSGQVATCTDVPDVAIAKVASAPVPTGVPEQYALTYTVTVSNAGATTGTYDLADAFAYAGATIDAVGTVAHGGSDPLETGLGALTTAGGAIVTGETIAAGASETYTYTVTFTLTDATTANDCTDPAHGLRNTATLGGSASGSAATCNGAPSVTIVKALAAESGAVAGLAEPGETLTYAITLTNVGAADQTAYGVTDPLDANVTFVSADHGGAFADGAVTWSGLTVPAHGTLTLNVAVKVADPIPAGVAAIGNVAYATGTTAPDCTATPRPANCTTLPAEGRVAIAKTVADANGDGLAEPGETLTYTITLTNTHGGEVSGYGVTDPLDANVAFVSADQGGVFANGAVTWSDLTIPAGGRVALTVVVTVADPLPADVAQIGNLAYATGGTPPDCAATPRPANCTVLAVPPPGAIAIAKTVADANGDGLAEPGETLTYTITLTNSGGQAMTGYGVTDPLDANVAFVSADHGGVFANGAVTWDGLTIAANGSLTLTVVVTVADPLPAGVAQIRNVAYATGTTPADCSAVPAPPSCAVIASAPAAGAPALQIQKSVNASSAGPGATLVYTIRVDNVGTVAATDAIVRDPIPAGIASYAWTCAAAGGAACAAASGSGALAEPVLALPAGGAVVYTVTATLAADPPSAITNVAEVASSGAVSCAPAGTAPPCMAQAVVTVTPGGGRAAVPTPVGSRWMLLMMAMVLAGAAVQVRRKS